MKKQSLTVIRTKRSLKIILNNEDVTMSWLNFFSGLSMKQEKDCVKLFLKKYGTRNTKTTKRTPRRNSK